MINSCQMSSDPSVRTNDYSSVSVSFSSSFQQELPIRSNLYQNFVVWRTDREFSPFVRLNFYRCFARAWKQKKGLRMQSNHRCFLFYLSIGIFLLLSLIIRHRMNEHFIVRSFCFWSNRSFFSLIICFDENGTFLCCLLCSIRHIRLWSRLLLILFVRNVQ